MGSSISSSKHERIVYVFLLAAILLTLACGINYTHPDPYDLRRHQEDLFWRQKIFGYADHSVNIVMIGDSRLYRGLDPAVFNRYFPGRISLNYGFSSAGHSPLMFAEADRLLTKSPSAPRVVILAITPYSLTPATQQNNHFLEVRKNGARSWQIIKDYYDPISLRHMRNIFTHKPDIVFTDSFEYHSDGWLRSNWPVPDTTRALASYAELFTNNQVDPKVILGLMDQIRNWCRQGVIVLGYRPPTTKAMVTLERKSGFDEAAFAQDFRASGGLWVDPGTAYQTYDGSHLTPDSAEKLSNLLAKTLVRALPKATNSPTK